MKERYLDWLESTEEPTGDYWDRWLAEQAYEDARRYSDARYAQEGM